MEDTVLEFCFWHTWTILVASSCPASISLFLCKACSAPMGMENGQIRDAQITASSENDEDHAAVQGRLNFKAGRGKTGAWSAYGNLVNQWLQVDLGRYSIVTGIVTQGRNAHPQWVTLYELQYSEDGVTFVYYKAPGQSSPKVSYAKT